MMTSLTMAYQFADEDYQSPIAAQRKTIKVRERSMGISVDDSGGDGPACVLLHGRGENSGVWGLFAESITADYRCVNIDLCGHGDSDWDPEGHYEARKLARDVFDVLDALEIEQPILIGHSLGAGVALHLTAMLRQRVAGLVLVDFCPEPDSPGAATVYAEIRNTPSRFATVEDYVQWLAERRPLARKEVLRHLARHALRRTNTGTYEPKMDRALGNASTCDEDSERFWTLLKNVACSCLVVRGMGSAVLSPHIAKRMLLTLPAAEMTTVSAAGHAVMTDNPEGFLRAVAKFLGSLALCEPTI
jgi:pimeloyl-ACP methyl ester carboxylesterase